MPAIALMVQESLSWLIKVVTTPRDIEYVPNKVHMTKSSSCLGYNLMRPANT